MTYTYAILDVSPATYQEIRKKLDEAGYQQAFHRDGVHEVIDMHGIALRAEAAETEPPPPVDLSTFGGGLHGVLKVTSSAFRGPCFFKSAPPVIALTKWEFAGHRMLGLALLRGKDVVYSLGGVAEVEVRAIMPHGTSGHNFYVTVAPDETA